MDKNEILWQWRSLKRWIKSDHYKCPKGHKFRKRFYFPFANMMVRCDCGEWGEIIREKSEVFIGKDYFLPFFDHSGTKGRLRKDGYITSKLDIKEIEKMEGKVFASDKELDQEADRNRMMIDRETEKEQDRKYMEQARRIHNLR